VFEKEANRIKNAPGKMTGFVKKRNPLQKKRTYRNALEDTYRKM